MKEQENDKWLDELISRTVNSEEPRFDAEQFRRKYPAEFQTLLSRATRNAPARAAGLSGNWPRIIRSPFVRLAAAAVIIVAIVLFIPRPAPDHPAPEPAPQAAKSPTTMMTGMSLAMAYRRGGMEALDRQLDETIRLFGSAQPKLSMRDLLEDFEG
ncbi:MAG: hypothetical protein JSU94_20460 [Phycisphaerales bacterium]|nr:MAG: hypothetical protein JSU94_20460 [Phycisphaerales bacterium]